MKLWNLLIVLVLLICNREFNALFCSIVLNFTVCLFFSNFCKTYSLGEVETARSHLVFQGHRPDEVTSLKLKEVTKHMRRCTEARKRQDWCAMLKEAMEATTSGAVVSSQVKLYLVVTFCDE